MLKATVKTCYACKTEKPVTDFYKSNVTYYQKECKTYLEHEKYSPISNNVLALS